MGTPTENSSASLDVQKRDAEMGGPSTLAVAMREGLPPSDPAARAQMACQLRQDFIANFELSLDARDRELWKQHGLGQPDALHLQRIGTKLDSFIIAQAYVQGTWLLWVEPVLYRISQWGTGESDGPEMLERFMRAIVHWSRAIRGRSRLPTNDPELRVAKQKIVGELKILQNAIRAELAGKRRFPDRRKIIFLIEEKLRESESVYVYLSGQNLVSLLRFLEQDEISSNFASGGITPTAFFYQWAGWAFVIDPEFLRQKISGFGTNPRHGRGSASL